MEKTIIIQTEKIGSILHELARKLFLLETTRIASRRREIIESIMEESGEIKQIEKMLGLGNKRGSE